ncbi:MAG: hypothetical protein RRY76_00315, partial [Clostridia bacterium]
IYESATPTTSKDSITIVADKEISKIKIYTAKKFNAEIFVETNGKQTSIGKITSFYNLFELDKTIKVDKIIILFADNPSVIINEVVFE